MRRHLSIKVYGKVQGVFYRATAKEVADSLGVKGFVRNQSDGSVYIEAEGTQAQLKQLVDWCSSGPPRAVVSNVEIADGTTVGFTAFEIRR